MPAPVRIGMNALPVDVPATPVPLAGITVPTLAVTCVAALPVVATESTLPTEIPATLATANVGAATAAAPVVVVFAP